MLVPLSKSSRRRADIFFSFFSSDAFFSFDFLNFAQKEEVHVVFNNT